MSSTTRRLGVDDADAYWRERKAGDRAKEGRMHRVVVGLIDERFPDGGKVLDCGVGDGHVYRLASARHRAFGVEQSPEVIANYDFPADTVEQADLNDGIPEFNGESFDAIVISMVLHWLDDPGGFLEVAAKRLTGRGRLYVIIPNVVNYRHRIDLLRGRFPKISLSHRNIMTPPEVEAMIRMHGLKIEQRLSSKNDFRNRCWPFLFAKDLIYVLDGGR
ncbi:MAG: class I SAM-dependent methyltransferase [Verrucomicrobiota bacterium]